MNIFSFKKSPYIEAIDWSDTNSHDIVHRIPNLFIKMGAILKVTEHQAAVFVSEGKVADVFGPGTFILSQENLPVLSRQKSWEAGFKGPFRAEIYYVNTQRLTDLKWQTINPITINTIERGFVRVMANGSYNLRVNHAEKFMKVIFGTNQIFDTAYLLRQYMSKINIKLSEVLSQKSIAVDQPPSYYDEISTQVENELRGQLSTLGLEIHCFIIMNLNTTESLGSETQVLFAPKVKP